MITTFLSGVITSALLISSTLSSTAPTSRFAFTQVLPEGNVVAHTVQPGESLESIAQDYYGDKAYWKNLWNDNQWIEDPNVLEDGFSVTMQVQKPEKADELIAVLMPKDTKKQIERLEAILAPTPTQTPVTPATPVVASPTTFEEVYKEAGTKYGVPWQILYGLHITETGGRDGSISNHQGSGAQGPMQFMPGTWRAYGVDGNGDGVADINNATDAIHGAANYLAKHGSLQSGLRSYGGNTPGTLSLARAKGYQQ